MGKGEEIDDFNVAYDSTASLLTDRREPPKQNYEVPNTWLREMNHNQRSPIWSLITPHLMHSTVASAAFQGAARQGLILESWQWVLELIRSGSLVDYPDLPKNSRATPSVGETNAWTRIFTICAEDIGPSNPALMIAAADIASKVKQFKTMQEVEIEAMTFVKYLCVAVKSRATDWACISRFNVPETYDHVFFYNKLIESLANDNLAAAIGYSEGITTHGFLASSQVKASKRIQNTFTKDIYNSLSQGIDRRPFRNNAAMMNWLAFRFAYQWHVNNSKKQFPTVNKILTALEKIHFDWDGFTWKKAARLLQRYAIVVIFKREEVEKRGLLWISGDPENEYFKWDQNQMERFRVHTRDVGLIYGVPDSAMDKHNKIGKTKFGRGFMHFVQIKSRIRFEDPNYLQFNDQMISCALSGRYKKDPAFIVEMRKDHHLVNELESRALKNPQRITFGFEFDLNEAAIKEIYNRLRRAYHEPNSPIAFLADDKILKEDEHLQRVKTSRDPNDIKTDNIGNFRIGFKNYNEGGKKGLEILKFMALAQNQPKSGLLGLHDPDPEITKKNIINSGILNVFTLYLGAKVVPEGKGNVIIFLEDNMDHQYGNVAFTY